MSSILNEKKTVLRAILLHEFKLHGNAAKATKNITDAWGEGVISERQVDRWFARFRSNILSLEIEEGRGRSSLIDDEALKELVESDTRQTTRELAVHMGVAKNTISRHLNIIGKVKN
jgi:transposase